MARDQRKSYRAVSEVHVQYRTVGSFLSDYAINFSEGGVFLHSEDPLPLGAKVRLVFSLPDMPVLFDVSGKVKWVITEDQAKSSGELPGMGIEFIHLDEIIRKRFEKFVRKLDDDLPDSLRETESPKPQIKVKRTGDPSRKARTKFGPRPERVRRRGRDEDE